MRKLAGNDKKDTQKAQGTRSSRDKEINGEELSHSCQQGMPGLTSRLKAVPENYSKMVQGNDERMGRSLSGKEFERDETQGKV
jgi:hypothetical protein